MKSNFEMPYLGRQLTWRRIASRRPKPPGGDRDPIEKIRTGVATDTERPGWMWASV